MSAAAPAGSALLVYVAALAAYAMTLRFGFLYDDIWTIQENAFVKDWRNVARLFTADYLHGVPDNNRPVMLLSVMLDYQLWGGNAAGYHVQNVLWHALTSALVFHLIRRVFADGRLALAAGLVFAVHPIHTEPVSAVNYREDVLAALFVLAALLLALRARERGGVARWLGSGLCVALGILSKESALVAPALLLACDATSGGGVRAALKRHWWHYVAGAAICASVFAPLALAIGDSYASIARDGAPLAERLLATPGIFVGYLGQLALPLSQSAEYTVDVERVDGATAWAAAAILAAVGAGAWWLRRRAAWATWGIAWLLLALAPVANAVAIANPRADRYLYLPSVGAAAVLGGLLVTAGRALARRGPARAWLVPLALVCAVLAAQTVRRSLVWQTPYSLWSRTVVDAPRSTRAWAGLAFAAIGESRPTEALAAARSGRALDPDDGRLLMAEGIALAELDRLPEAVTRLRAATTRLPPSQRHRAANNLAVVYQRLGDDGAAEIRFREAIAASPTDARYHRNLAELLEHRGRRAEARASYRRALELAPEDRAARAAVEHLP